MVFSNIEVSGNFYNSSGWTLMAGGGGGPPGSTSMAAASGHSVAMTVNGVSTPIIPGQAYSGVIVLTIS
jgi:hypothetical protein